MMIQQVTASPSTSTYRTRHIAQAVNQSQRTVQLFLRRKFPEREGWHLFSESEYQALVAELKAAIPVRLANRRRACFLSKKRL